MSNNLRQIAKDLRSFVKRCKDVHYSDSLLISFLITGLLTIAPKLHADVASEQQEITAQTYDAITDLRQSFMRARKENEKSLKGAQSELVQLLRQGDQVIKSPWSSYQFGTGYINNDWGTTYRGRGGKFLEYFRRNNDLTKYVFDANKHLYGATNLNIPRNKEPNSLTINPANIYKPYNPYTPEKLDNVYVPTAPNFEYDIRKPEGVSTYDYQNVRQSVNRSINIDVNVDPNSISVTQPSNNYNTTYANTGGNDTDTKATLEVTGSGGTLHNTNYWWGGAQTTYGSVSTVSSGQWHVGDRSSAYGWGYPYSGSWGYSWWGYGGGYIQYSHVDINGSGSRWGWDDNNFNYWTGYGSGQITYDHWDWARRVAFSTPGLADGNWSNANSGTKEVYKHTYTYTTGGGGTSSYTIYTTSSSAPGFNSLLASGYDGVSNSYASGGFQGYTYDIVNSTWSSAPTYLSYWGTTPSYGHTPVNAAIKVDGKSITTSGNTFDINGYSYTTTNLDRSGIIVTSKAGSEVISSGDVFNVKGDKNNGILAQGKVVSSGDTFNLEGTQNVGIKNSATGTTSTDDTFNVKGDNSKNIGFYQTGGSGAFTHSIFNIAQGVTNDGVRDESDGILATGGNISTAYHYVSATDHGDTTFNIWGYGNNGIRFQGGIGTSIDATFNVHGTYNNGLLLMQRV